MSKSKSLHKVATTVIERVKSRQNNDTETPAWVKQVAMLTGVLAAISGFLALRSTTLTNDAIYESNQAILAQTESSDSWSEYQAESIKARIVETQLAATHNISTSQKALLTNEAMDLRNRQPAIKKIATDKAHERDDHLKDGLKRLAEKDLLGYADVAAQLGIALASVAALVQVRIAFHAGITAGAFGLGIAAYALAIHYGLIAG